MYRWKTVTYGDSRPDDWHEVVVEVATLADFEEELREHGIDPATLSEHDIDKLRDLFADACQFSGAVTTAVEVFAETRQGRQR